MGTSASPCLVQDVPVHEPGAVAQAHQFHHLGQLRCVDTGWENHVSVGRVLVLSNPTGGGGGRGGGDPTTVECLFSIITRRSGWRRTVIALQVGSVVKQELGLGRN